MAGFTPLLALVSLTLLGAYLPRNSAHAQECQIGQVFHEPPTRDDRFGLSCLLHQGSLFVGAPRVDPFLGILSVGAVEVYHRSGGNLFLSELLHPLLVQGGTGFGSALAAHEDRLVVGASSYDDNVSSVFDIGAAYVFENLGGHWTESAMLLASTPEKGSDFAEALDIDEDLIVVGAAEEDSIFASSGAAYVYEYQSGVWIETQRLLPSTTFVQDRFGSAVGCSSQDIVIGAPGGVDANGIPSGVVYVFQLQGGIWTETEQVAPSDANLGDFFGQALALDEDLLVVASPLDGDIVGKGGSAYVFEKQADGTWLEKQKLVPSVSVSFGQFGFSVSISERDILVGATGGGPNGGGSACLFREQGGVWVEVAELFQPGYIGDEYLGWSVALEMEVAAAGAPFGRVQNQSSNHQVQAGLTSIWSIDGSLCPTLSGSVDSISLSTGGTQCLDLQAGEEVAGSVYWTVGSMSGTSPGFPLGSYLVPINPDDYFFAVLAPSPTSPLVGTTGTLDDQGTGSSQLVVPPGSDLSLVGTLVHHAAVVFSLSPLSFEHVSNPVALTLDP